MLRKERLNFKAWCSSAIACIHHRHEASLPHLPSLSRSLETKETEDNGLRFPLEIICLATQIFLAPKQHSYVQYILGAVRCKIE